MRDSAAPMSGPANPPTTLERDGEGDFLLDPALLAERFALSTERFRRLLRAGHVRSSVEQGLGEDEGRQRLTVRCGNRAWTAVVDAGGNVVSENFTVLRHAPAR
ncbi:MAG: DUF6522 family protein [Rhizobiaceae bacterium]|jgi:hypothetical protein